VLGLVWTGSFLWSRAELEGAVRTIACDGLDDGLMGLYNRCRSSSGRVPRRINGPLGTRLPNSRQVIQRLN
jgi:hypothetical protein